MSAAPPVKGTAVVLDTRKLWQAVHYRLFKTSKTAKEVAELLGFTPQIFSDLKAAATGIGGRTGVHSYTPSSSVFLTICWWLNADPRDYQQIRRDVQSEIDFDAAYEPETRIAAELAERHERG